MKESHPKELYVLALAELCERYTFWGIGNLLVLYLIDYYKFSAESAAHTYGIFTGFAAFLPLIGGYIADRWNYHHPLFIGVFTNVLGCIFLATGNPTLMYIALGIIALGFGIFTPSILTLLGFTYRTRPNLREGGFSIYYASVNIGVFLAMMSLGITAQQFGWRAAFILAGLVQLLGLVPLIWYIKKHHVYYKDMHPTKALVGNSDEAVPAKQKKHIIVILVLTLFSIVFWMPYSQGFSSMSVFVLNYIHRNFGSFEIPTAWILSSESFFLILLAPFFASLYKYLQKIKRDPSPSVKTALSLVSMAICFAIMLFISRKIPIGATKAELPFIYPIIAYFFMAVGEMLLAPIGLSLVANLAPRRFTALLIGTWYVCAGFAFYLGGLFAGLIQKIPSLAEFFSIFFFVAIIPAILLFCFARKLTRMSK